jgi:hypothetical protein
MNIGSNTSLSYLSIFYPTNPKTKTPSLFKKMGFSGIASWTSLSVKVAGITKAKLKFVNTNLNK